VGSLGSPASASSLSYNAMVAGGSRSPTRAFDDPLSESSGHISAKPLQPPPVPARRSLGAQEMHEVSTDVSTLTT
jgi:hypothetical protein